MVTIPSDGRCGRYLRLVAFLSGPVIVIFFWVLVVYVFERSHYISFCERIDELTPVLPIGFVIGLVGAVVVAVRMYFSD